MNFSVVIHAVSMLVMVLSGAMLSAIPAAGYMQDTPSVIGRMAVCGGSCFLLSLTFFLATMRSRQKENFGIREGFLAVGAAWLVMVLFGTLPFLLIGKFTFWDAVFESASGLSTTGATIIEPGMPVLSGSSPANGIESLPAALLYWRSMLNWLGGVGVVMFVLLVLPARGGTEGHQLYNAEVPGVKTASDQVTPRMVTSVRVILASYLLLTGVTIFLFRLGGMSIFDAVCHAFSTVSTGGFSTRNSSMAEMSPFIHWTAAGIMFLSACNFTLVVKLIFSRKIAFLRDEEFRFFFFVVLLAGIAAGGILCFSGTDAAFPAMKGMDPVSRTGYSLRTAFFTVISMISTTGFAISDYTVWNLPGASAVIFLVMLCGGCGGSTSGGIKCTRILLALKQAFSELRHGIFPHAVTDIRLNGERIEGTVIGKTLAFMSLYMMILFLTAAVLPFLCRMDLLTALSAAQACLGNVGPGFGGVGPSCTYQWLTPSAKLLLSAVMIAGRLELYTILVLFLPSFWKN